ncbi:hypothetical protein GUITHDRAFT_155342 [Guillardia theta CCMP2712]|uniref:DUF547 domain-containing protein n=1 Tax=Guillardia theta (strain CCMP2712) TaxID=905079 RepID=L1IIV3_GUITC|nr:hypothetical protein GUITHDRAFT_155342 [Guillardia theta CCMP2712]EKX36032.1 hypothetical protein GUITHDRAFT_155342 [Guillardia theta CCMP2712]|eukprot:XP_005823012.1 hypothetical protein GUITHDRAFT_155342 [Guillardia theta CCMP2712]
MASGAPRSKTFERPLIVGVLGYLQLLPRATGLRVLNDKTSAGKAAGEQEGDLSAALRRSMTTLYGRHLSEDGTQLDYGGMAASEEYAGYKALAEGLREVDTRSMGEEERVAFFINVYNCLVIDAIISLGEPKDLLSRLRMYAEAAYNIGGANFSLNDIENGVLRGNQSPPTINPFAQKPFGEGDARAGIACKKPDPRIHFALNCGARGCPPIRFYRGEELDAMLDKAARSFCKSIEVDQDKGVVYMSQIFKWYENDFQSDSTDKPPVSTLRFVEKYLDEDKKDALSRFLESGKVPELKFQPYDWGLNSK